jgi:tetrahydromethanopterin S-methyltransferase subunit A
MNTALNPTVSRAVVGVMRRAETVRDRLTTHLAKWVRRDRRTALAWPVIPGAYRVGTAIGSIAVCTLTCSGPVEAMAALPGVAIAGRVYTANLGIEKILANLSANPSIRFLVLCGKDSPFFQAGQALRSLWANGLASDGRIIGAQGHFPVLKSVTPDQVDKLRRQIELIDRTGELEVDALAGIICQLSAQQSAGQQLAGRQLEANQLAVPNRGSYAGSPKTGNISSGLGPVGKAASQDGFILLKPGGRREPLSRDPQGFFIISLDRQAGEIIVQHYLADHQPAHRMRGRNGEAILLGLLKAGLITQMSHAGYLGAELAKAETGLRLELAYEQDRPLGPRNSRGMS